MSDTPGYDREPTGDRGSGPAVNPQGFLQGASNLPPPAEQVRGLIRPLVLVAVLSVVVLLVVVALAVRSISDLSL